MTTKLLFRQKGIFSHYILLLVIFNSILFFPWLGKSDLYRHSEPRYAQVSKEMMNSHDFILPHLNTEPYPDQPPVFFWLIILCSLPFGEITELSSRLPSALAGLGCAIMTYYFGVKLFEDLKKGTYNRKYEALNNKLTLINPRRVGFFAALILSTNIKYFATARNVSFDLLVSLFVTWSLFFFYKAYTGKTKNLKFYLLSYFFMAIGTLTKGPVGLALPILVIAAFLITVKLKYGKHHSNFSLNDMRIGWGVVIVLGLPLL